MSAKEYLQQQRKWLKALRREADRKLDRLEELREYNTLSASDPGRVRVQGGRLPGDALAVDLLVKIESARAAYLAASVELHEAETRLLEQIHALSNWKYIVVLYSYYLRSETMKSIAAELSTNYSYACELKEKALAAFEAVNGLGGEVP